LVECHPMQLMLVDVHLVGGKERLPDDVDLPTHERRAFPRGGRESANMDGGRATFIGLGGHPTAVKRPGVSAHTWVEV
jgi:hypothetical protein